MCCHERGMALITVLMLSALLLVLALVLGERVLRNTRDMACSGAREQALQAATATIEWGRATLAEEFQATQGWNSLLAAAGSVERYPQSPAYRLPVGGISTELYLRDNPDGDDDPHQDNDLRIFVLARARTSLGPEVTVESLCELSGDAGSRYAQAGGSAGRSGQLAVEGPADLSSAPVAKFSLGD